MLRPLIKPIVKIQNPYKSNAERKAFIEGYLSKEYLNPYRASGWNSNPTAHKAYKAGFNSK